MAIRDPGRERYAHQEDHDLDESFRASQKGSVEIGKAKGRYDDLALIRERVWNVIESEIVQRASALGSRSASIVLRTFVNAKSGSRMREDILFLLEMFIIYARLILLGLNRNESGYGDP